jgi:hypothetical protein
MTASVSEEELERLEAENRAASSWGASLATPVPGAVSNAMVERREAEERIMQDYRWGNLTPLGVANHLRRAGFNLEYATAKANALEAAVQSPPIVGVGATVKPLEWEDLGPRWEANCLLGRYVVADVGGYVHLRLNTPLLINVGEAWNHATIEAAKAAAQADFEARILSSLAPVEAVATEPVAWRWRWPNGVWNYQEARQVIPGLEQQEPLYAAPTGDSGALREALAELADLMDDVVAGNYFPDSFTTQPARAALSKGEPGK